MDIIIVGAGIVGHSLAEHLVKIKDHQITVVDSDPEAIRNLTARLDVQAVTGDGSDPGILDRAGIRDADILIAVTPNDQVNLLSCHFACQTGVGKRIARIQSPAYTAESSPVSLQTLGVTDVMCVEQKIVNKALQHVEIPGLTHSGNFHSESVCLRGCVIAADMPVADRTLAELAELTGDSQMLVVLLARDGQSIVPSGTDVIRAGDEIITIMPRSSLQTFKSLINCPTDKHKKIVVSGDSLAAIMLAESLKPYAERVMLVDPDPVHGEEAAARLTGVEVLHGDCTDVDMLHDINIENAQFFIAAEKDTENNIVACLLAKAEGTAEVIVVNNSERHAELFHSIGIDQIINPRLLTSQKIIGSIMRVPIASLMPLKHVDVEISRFNVGLNSRLADQAIRDVGELQRGSLIIGCIVREETVIIPSGGTIVRSGDELLVIGPAERIHTVERLVKARRGLGRR